MEDLFATPNLPVTEKLDRLLQIISERVGGVGKYVSPIMFQSLSVQASIWCMDKEEMDGLFSTLVELQRISYQPDLSSVVANPNYITVTYRGWQRLEEINATRASHTQGFVAMWFNDKVAPAYNNAIAPGIRDAGYTPVRIDQVEHNDKIDDRILREIRRSRFVVADATGNRGGVYYEAGFAQGLGIPVFWTARKGVKLHFDVRQHNCTFWENDKLGAFRKNLANRIAAVLGDGPIKL